MHPSAFVLLAAEAAPAQEGGGILNAIIQNTFYLALLFVFLAAIVGAFVAARKRDRCLKKFRDFPVMVEEQTGRIVWGRLRVFSKGLELLFETPYDRPAKNSFLVYEAEVGRILALYRFTDRLGEKDSRRCARQARRLAAPPLTSRIWRTLRNIINTFRDAIVQALGMSVQQAAKARPSPVLATGGGQIAGIGTTLVGETANAYEPMLEQYIGDPVILELTNPADPEKRSVEYYGHLGEYSAQFILLVGVHRRFQAKAPLTGGESRFLGDAVRARAEGERLIVENRSKVDVQVEGFHAGDACRDIDQTVPAGETVEIAVPEECRVEGAAAAISYERRFDIIVPRACGIVRHASAAPNESPGASGGAVVATDSGRGAGL